MRWAGRPRAEWLRAVAWAPTLAAPVFLGLLAARFDRLVAAIHTNSDAVAPALMAESLGRGGPHGGPTVLGDISYASTLMLFAATRALPGHRELWDLVPVAFALAGALLLAWSSYRLAGRWAGAMTLALGVAIGTDALFTQLAPAFHGATWFTGNLLAAFLVALATGAVRGPRARWALAICVGLVCGVNLASDPLLAITGVLPLVLAAVLGPRTPEARARRGAVLATAGIAVATAAAAIAALSLARLRTRRFERGDSYLAVASPEDVARHLDQLWRYTLAVFGAGRGDGGLDLWPDAPLAVVAALAVGAVLWIGLARSRHDGSAAALVARFWAIACVLLMAGFAISQIPDPDSSLGARDGLIVPDRYLVPFVFAVAAVLPVWAAGRMGRRVAVALGATVLTGAALAALATSDLATPRERLEAVRQTDAIAAHLRAEGVEHGFADYWTAGALTYATGVPTRAIIDCELGPAVVPCPLRVNSRRGWYRPRPGRSFVLVDRSTDAGRRLDALVGSGALGAAVTSRRLGRIRIHVFERDVALSLQRRWGAAERPAPG